MGKKMLLITGLILITILHFTIASGTHSHHVFHIILRTAYLIPIIAASIWYGWRGALATTLPVSLIFSLHILVSWRGQQAENLNQWSVLGIFLMVGTATAFLSEQVNQERIKAYKQQLTIRRRLMLEALESLSAALGWRDGYTGTHSERVSILSVSIAQKMNLSVDRVEMIRLAARIHDIGKIGVRDDILFKPDVLDLDERRAIEQHPVVAADILKPIEGCEEISKWVLAHHEQPDGQGYPSGKKMEEIPLEAAIISVADVFAALTENRPYHHGLSTQDALDLMKSWRGTKLRSDVFDTFCNVLV